MEVESRSLRIFFCLRISHPPSGNNCVCDGVRKHTPRRTHIFLTHFPCVACRHRVHAWLKVFAARMSLLSVSPSPFSCFICRPCCSRTVTSTPRSRLHLPCRTVPDPKARVKRTSARAARSLATWPVPRTPQVMNPKSSTRLLLQTETRRLSTIRTTITSLTSQKHTREHWTVRCFHNVRSLCFVCLESLYVCLLRRRVIASPLTSESEDTETLSDSCQQCRT